MPTLQELERPLDEAIVNGLIEATPEWWVAAVLRISRTEAQTGRKGFAHIITSPEGHRDIVQATSDITEATFKLADLFAKFGKPWKQVVYSIQKLPEGGWKYVADYDY
jgi:hypothetical protein